MTDTAWLRDLVRTIAGATVAGFGFWIELAFLDGRAKLGDVPATSLITYTDA